MDDYKYLISKHAGMGMEDLRGEDVEEAIQNLKETAGGLEQWTPADLKLLSNKACPGLAEVFGMIEKGA